jgi:hypothetical protein
MPRVASASSALRSLFARRRGSEAMARRVMQAGRSVLQMGEDFVRDTGTHRAPHHGEPFLV